MRRAASVRQLAYGWISPSRLAFYVLSVSRVAPPSAQRLHRRSNPFLSLGRCDERSVVLRGRGEHLAHYSRAGHDALLTTWSRCCRVLRCARSPRETGITPRRNRRRLLGGPARRLADGTTPQKWHREKQDASGDQETRPRPLHYHNRLRKSLTIGRLKEEIVCDARAALVESRSPHMNQYGDRPQGAVVVTFAFPTPRPATSPLNVSRRMTSVSAVPQCRATG